MAAVRTSDLRKRKKDSATVMIQASSKCPAQRSQGRYSIMMLGRSSLQQSEHVFANQMTWKGRVVLKYWSSIIKQIWCSRQNRCHTLCKEIGNHVLFFRKILKVSILENKLIICSGTTNVQLPTLPCFAVVLGTYQQ